MAHTASETASIPCKRARSSSDASPSVLSLDEHVNQNVPENPTTSTVSNNITFPPMKRRVNPDSLASRLEPNLVRDMNALIVPGNIEMPSFAVRKELQERYNIDRRHIYDYFHSKGLRVIKDDKVSNLVRRTERPTKIPPVTLRPIRQAQPRKYHSIDVVRHGVSVPRAKLDKSAAANRVKRHAKSRPQVTPHGPTLTIPGNPACLLFDSSSVCQIQQSCYLATENLTVDFNNLREDPLFDGFPYSRAFSRTSHSYGYDDSGQMTDFCRVPSPCSGFSEDYIANAGFGLPQGQTLSKTERMAIYNFLNDILGPACGIQESVGTYREHMQELSCLYYDRLYRKSSRTFGNLSRNPCTPVSYESDSSATEFRKWLVCGQKASVASHVLSNSKLRVTTSEPSFPLFTAHMGKEGTDCDSSRPCNVGWEPFIFSGYNDDHTLFGLVPELLPDDTLSHLLDPCDPVVRSTVPCPGTEQEDQNMITSKRESNTLSDIGLSAIDDKNKEQNQSIVLSLAHLSPCDSRSPHSMSTDHGRDRSARLKSSAAVITPIGSEVAISKERCHQIPFSAFCPINKTAAVRVSRTSRKRSSSAVSSRLRTTSAGGGM